MPTALRHTSTGGPKGHPTGLSAGTSSGQQAGTLSLSLQIRTHPGVHLQSQRQREGDPGPGQPPCSITREVPGGGPGPRSRRGRSCVQAAEASRALFKVFHSCWCIPGPPCSPQSWPWQTAGLPVGHGWSSWSRAQNAGSVFAAPKKSTGLGHAICSWGTS